MNKFVCSFRGRRDSYQVPRALDEADLLDVFFTDLYATPAIQQISSILPSPWDEKISRRHDPALSTSRVKCLLKAMVKEWSFRGLGVPNSQIYRQLNQSYSKAAAKRARESKSNLLLYTPYAWEAFTASYPHNPKRILFQYHPHVTYEREILEEDALQYPYLEFNSSDQDDSSYDDRSGQSERRRDVWRYADLILCASSFTKRSMVAQGANPAKCRVIPYGVQLPPPSMDLNNMKGGFHALFVGSGVQRKGLHHLLLAWEKADLPLKSSLTLVCRSITSRLEEMVANCEKSNVCLLSEVPLSKLISLYCTSTVFAMPSLVEGFGQVYLESLFYGCPVLGTANTCLPDLGGEEEGVFLTEPSNVEKLKGRLEELSAVLPGNYEVRKRAKTVAQRHTWRRFRNRLVQSLNVAGL